MLHTYLIAAFGDMPAVTKLMNMKGHNGKLPCRACNIHGVHARNGPNVNTNYVPLGQPFNDDPQSPCHYKPLELPLRTHAQYLWQAMRVEEAKNDVEEDHRSMQTGINGLSPLACVPGLEFPHSFPHDFMHLMFQNIIPTLLDLWTHSGHFELFETEDGKDILHADLWMSIAAACPLAGNLIPYAFGCRVPDLKKKHAELVCLINLCIDFEIPHDTVDMIRQGFAKWVKDYEKEIELPSLVKTRVAAYISHETGVAQQDVSNVLGVMHVKAWGRMQQLDKSLTGVNVGSDVIQGVMLVSNNETTRDASHVRFHSKFSCWRWDHIHPIEVYEEVLSYGQAQAFVIIERDFIECLGAPNPRQYVLAVISPFPQLRYHPDADLVEYRLTSGNYASPEVVDATKIDCLIGHVEDRGSYIVEQTSVVGRMDMLDVTVNPD
ncbi:hypothetical protein FRC11_011322 [Ceratobasidium sp. 423]|nr:hypothetical protein FRC11_011322 [Ceratobasidium sp. 423]